MTDKNVTEPTLTANAILLVGHISAHLIEARSQFFSVVEVRPAKAAIIVKSWSGNTFAVTVSQIGGVE